jgi:muconolactone delta-isomerase
MTRRLSSSQLALTAQLAMSRLKTLWRIVGHWPTLHLGLAQLTLDMALITLELISIRLPPGLWRPILVPIISETPISQLPTSRVLASHWLTTNPLLPTAGSTRRQYHFPVAAHWFLVPVIKPGIPQFQLQSMSLFWMTPFKGQVEARAMGKRTFSNYDAVESEVWNRSI